LKVKPTRKTGGAIFDRNYARRAGWIAGGHPSHIGGSA
jgi:hypothetical protein